MTALAAFHMLLPFAVAVLMIYTLFRFIRVVVRLALIIVLFTALGSGLVYTPQYQAFIHLVTGLI